MGVITCTSQLKSDPGNISLGFKSNTTVNETERTCMFPVNSTATTVDDDNDDDDDDENSADSNTDRYQWQRCAGITWITNHQNDTLAE